MATATRRRHRQPHQRASKSNSENAGGLRKRKWLRDPKIFPDASVDLVYLDPPFNSNADYNVLFREASGTIQT
jgi:16S rRNA G966 N2-methylase RsmD